MESNLRDSMLARGWASGASWREAGHSYDPYTDHWSANPYVSLQPPVVVAASAPPAPPPERAELAPDGSFLPGTVADAKLRAWTCPIAAGTSAAPFPLLIIGQSIWEATSKVLRGLRAYPTTYARISVDELPTNETTLGIFRANTAYSTVVKVYLPSLPVAAAFAARTRWLRSHCPHTSFAFFIVADVDWTGRLPGAIADNYTTIAWQEASPSYRPPTAGGGQRDSDDAIRTIEASATRTGWLPRAGLTPEQRMGMARVPFRDEAAAILHMQAAAAARHIAAIAGESVRDAKRVRLSDFNRGAGVTSRKDHEQVMDARAKMQVNAAAQRFIVPSLTPATDKNGAV